MQSDFKKQNESIISADSSSLNNSKTNSTNKRSRNDSVSISASKSQIPTESEDINNLIEILDKYEVTNYIDIPILCSLIQIKSDFSVEKCSEYINEVFQVLEKLSTFVFWNNTLEAFLNSSQTDYLGLRTLIKERKLNENIQKDMWNITRRLIEHSPSGLFTSWQALFSFYIYSTIYYCAALKWFESKNISLYQMYPLGMLILYVQIISYTIRLLYLVSMYNTHAVGFGIQCIQENIIKTSINNCEFQHFKSQKLPSLHPMAGFRLFQNDLVFVSKNIENVIGGGFLGILIQGSSEFTEREARKRYNMELNVQNILSKFLLSLQMENALNYFDNQHYVTDTEKNLLTTWVSIIKSMQYSTFLKRPWTYIMPFLSCKLSYKSLAMVIYALPPRPPLLMRVKSTEINLELSQLHEIASNHLNLSQIMRNTCILQYEPEVPKSYILYQTYHLLQYEPADTNEHLRTDSKPFRPELIDFCILNDFPQNPDVEDYLFNIYNPIPNKSKHAHIYSKHDFTYKLRQLIDKDLTAQKTYTPYKLQSFMVERHLPRIVETFELQYTNAPFDAKSLKTWLHTLGIGYRFCGYILSKAKHRWATSMLTCFIVSRILKNEWLDLLNEALSQDIKKEGTKYLWFYSAYPEYMEFNKNTDHAIFEIYALLLLNLTIGNSDLCRYFWNAIILPKSVVHYSCTVTQLSKEFCTPYLLINMFAEIIGLILKVDVETIKLRLKNNIQVLSIEDFSSWNVSLKSSLNENFFNETLYIFDLLQKEYQFPLVRNDNHSLIQEITLHSSEFEEPNEAQIFLSKHVLFVMELAMDYNFQYTQILKEELILRLTPIGDILDLNGTIRIPWYHDPENKFIYALSSVDDNEVNDVLLNCIEIQQISWHLLYSTLEYLSFFSRHLLWNFGLKLTNILKRIINERYIACVLFYWYIIIFTYYEDLTNYKLDNLPQSVINELQFQFNQALSIIKSLFEDTIHPLEINTYLVQSWIFYTSTNLEQCYTVLKKAARQSVLSLNIHSNETDVLSIISETDFKSYSFQTIGILHSMGNILMHQALSIMLETDVETGNIYEVIKTNDFRSSADHASFKAYCQESLSCSKFVLDCLLAKNMIYKNLFFLSESYYCTAESLWIYYTLSDPTYIFSNLFIKTCLNYSYMAYRIRLRFYGPHSFYVFYSLIQLAYMYDGISQYQITQKIWEYIFYAFQKKKNQIKNMFNPRMKRYNKLQPYLNILYMLSESHFIKIYEHYQIKSKKRSFYTKKFQNNLQSNIMYFDLLPPIIYLQHTCFRIYINYLFDPWQVTQILLLVYNLQQFEKYIIQIISNMEYKNYNNLKNYSYSVYTKFPDTTILIDDMHNLLSKTYEEKQDVINNFWKTSIWEKYLKSLLEYLSLMEVKQSLVNYIFDEHKFNEHVNISWPYTQSYIDIESYLELLITESLDIYQKFKNFCLMTIENNTFQEYLLKIYPPINKDLSVLNIPKYLNIKKDFSNMPILQFINYKNDHFDLLIHLLYIYADPTSLKSLCCSILSKKEEKPIIKENRFSYIPSHSKIIQKIENFKLSSL